MAQEEESGRRRIIKTTDRIPERQIAVSKNANVQTCRLKKRGGAAGVACDDPAGVLKKTPDLPVAVRHMEILKKVWIFS